MYAPKLLLFDAVDTLGAFKRQVGSERHDGLQRQCKKKIHRRRRVEHPT